MEQLHQYLLEQGIARDTPIIRNILAKKNLLASASPGHANFKTALIVSGGGMRGVYSGGSVIALEQLGMREVFDTVIGISSGAATGGYFLAGQSEFGTSIYYEDLANRHFINPLRFNNILNIKHMENVFRNVKPLDQETVRKSRSHLLIGLTEAATGKGVYLDMQQYPYIDIVTAICASASIPGVTKGPITINGVAYSDGMTGCTNPIEFAIEQGATDILLVLNSPLGGRDALSLSEKLLSRVLLRKYTPEFRATHLTRRERTGYNNVPQDANIGVICPNYMPLGNLSIDRDLMKMIAIHSTAQSLRLFS